MAIYHLSVKTISRSAGRSATAAAAYRSGTKIVDSASGEIHNYEPRAKAVEVSLLLFPQGVKQCSRDELWNQAEAAERRKNSTVAREFEIALPADLDETQRNRLAFEFAQELVKRHGCVADLSIHKPHGKGDNRNHHAHILLTTRRFTNEGLTEKTRELDDLKSGEVTRWRERFAQLQNKYLERAGQESRVDHRTLKAQKVNREPTHHLGPSVTAINRRGGEARVMAQILWEKFQRMRTHRQRADDVLTRRAQRKAEAERKRKEAEKAKAVEVRETAIKPEKPKQPTLAELKELQFLASREGNRREWSRLDKEIKTMTRQTKPGSGIER